MIRSIRLNYRTDKNGTAYWDTYTVGEECFDFPGMTVKTSNIDVNWVDMSAEINLVQYDEEEKPTKEYKMTLKNLHFVLEE